MSTAADDQLCTTSGPPLIVKAGDSLHRRAAPCCPLSPSLFTAKRVKDNPSHDEHSVRHAACMHLTSGSPVDDHDLRRDRHRLFDPGGCQYVCREARAARSSHHVADPLIVISTRSRTQPSMQLSMAHTSRLSASRFTHISSNALSRSHLYTRTAASRLSFLPSRQPSILPSACGTQFNSCVAPRVSAHESPICTSVDTASRYIHHRLDSALIASQRAWCIMLVLCSSCLTVSCAFAV